MSSKVDQVIRQGDVYIILNQEKPKQAAKRDDRTLALGEATGHHHTLTGGVVYGDRASVQWIVAEEPVQLRHQEHATIEIPVGVHEVRIQREYTPDEVRQVSD